MRLSFFFLLILLLLFQKTIGYVSFDSSASCGYPLFFTAGLAECPFLSYLLLLRLSFTILYSYHFGLFSSLQYLLLLQCAGGDFVFVYFMLFGLRVRLDI